MYLRDHDVCAAEKPSFGESFLVLPAPVAGAPRPTWPASVGETARRCKAGPTHWRRHDGCSARAAFPRRRRPPHQRRSFTPKRWRAVRSAQLDVAAASVSRRVIAGSGLDLAGTAPASRPVAGGVLAAGQPFCHRRYRWADGGRLGRGAAGHTADHRGELPTTTIRSRAPPQSILLAVRAR